MLCGTVQAQNVEVTLNNGKVVKGETPSLSFYVDNEHEIRVKDKTSGEKSDFTSTDIKEIKYSSFGFRIQAVWAYSTCWRN